MVHVWDITIPRLSGDKPRRAYVYLPDSYFEDSERRYPVLYMFDGHNVFFDSHATYGKSWGMKDYMDFTETQVIIAAVECNDGANNERLMEYSPYTFHADFVKGPIKGKGRIYMDWLVKEFKPFIDEHLRTKPDRDHTMIAGSSMGGLMSMYAVLQYNHVFSRAACLSPSLWFNKKGLDQMLKKNQKLPDTIIYMDYGENEILHHPTMRRAYSHVASILLNKEILLETRIVPDGDHCEASWERQTPFFMNTILYGLEDLYPVYEETLSMDSEEFFGLFEESEGAQGDEYSEGEDFFEQL